MHGFIHHYTNLETLALILKHRTIRFNRLDRVDDVHEAQEISGIQFGKCFFASCWTASEEESIPLWHMYTSEMTGVRISLPVQMFNLLPLKPDPKSGFSSEGEILSPIPFDRLIAPSHFCPPIFLQPAQFYGAVEYDDNIAESYKTAVELHRDETRGTAGIQIHDPCRLARLKRKVWTFQSECRFVLFILPSMEFPALGFADPNFQGAFANFLLNALLNGAGPGIDHFDVELSEGALNQIVVTTGPLCSDGHHLIAESLVQKFTNGGSVQRSKLAGSIRKPRR